MTVVINGTTGITNPNNMTIGNGGGSVATNTAFGSSALAANTTGIAETAIGASALAANTSGDQNTAVGQTVLSSNTTGSYNTAVGRAALQANTTASNNTAVGYQAGYSNTDAANLTALGYQALYSSTTGSAGSTAVGRNAGRSNTGGYIQAFGENSLYNNTTGNFNTAFGGAALYSNTTASNNTAVGYQAGYTNNADYNVFVGQGSGYYVSSGSRNTLVGNYAGEQITTGSRNTVLGRYNGNAGGLDIRTASNYIVLSDGDGNPRGIFDSTGSFMLGTTTSGLHNSNSVVAIPYNGSVVGQIVCNHANATGSGERFAKFGYNGGEIGNISQSGTTAVSYNTTSDYRLKENVQPLSGALARIAALKPCTYTWKAAPEEIGEGFIAHELAEVCPHAVTGEKDAVDEKGNPKYQGIDTSFLVATLTAAIQELKAEFDAYKATHP